MTMGKIKLTEEQARRLKACTSAEELHSLLAEFGHDLKESEARARHDIMRNRKPSADSEIGTLAKWHDPGPET